MQTKKERFPGFPGTGPTRKMGIGARYGAGLDQVRAYMLLPAPCFWAGFVRISVNRIWDFFPENPLQGINESGPLTRSPFSQSLAIAHLAENPVRVITPAGSPGPARNTPAGTINVSVSLGRFP